MSTVTTEETPTHKIITVRADQPHMPYKSPRRKYRRVVEQLFTIDPESGCWIWTQVLTKGYGRYRYGGQFRQAHGVYWEAINGPIPEGLQLHHTCENKRCVNPDHLVALTQKEHSAVHPHPSWVAKLDPDKVREIRSYDPSITPRQIKELAERFGVQPNTILDVWKEETWQSVLSC